MKLHALALTLCATLGSSSALAGFEVVDAPATLQDIQGAKRVEVKHSPTPVRAASNELTVQAAPAPEAAKPLPVLTYQGTQQGSPKVIVGGAKNVKFADAVKQVANFPGWHAYKDKQIDPAKKVSWRGGKPWTEVLEDVMKQAGATAVVNWDNKTIHVSKAPVVEDVPVVTASLPAKGAAASPVATPSTKAKPAWEASPEDLTVRRVLEKWAQQAGWQKPFWYPESDYEISAFVRLEGGFEEALRSMAKNLNLEITIYRGNKIIVVRERG